MNVNNFVNFSVMAFGLFNFLGNVGGVIYLAVLLCEFYHDWKAQKRKPTASCSTCNSYKVCVEVMGGDLPDKPCAYWKKKP